MYKGKLMMLLTVCLIAASLFACGNAVMTNDSKRDNDMAENKETVENNVEEGQVTEDNTIENHATSNEEKEQVDFTLTELLPYQTGYAWKYDGTVEYGHEMELTKIDELDDRVVYRVEGLVDDASGGESSLDYILDVTYTVTEDSLTQTVDSEVMMDNIFPELELIHLPLSEGTKWTQTQVNAEGEEVTLESFIESIEEDGEQKIYTVIYEDVDSDYYEKRRIKEGVGVLSFEHLYIFDEDSMPMGYEINYDFTGFSH